MVNRIARNWPLLVTRRGAENEPATAVYNVRMYQRQPWIQVIMQAAERPSRCYSFLKEMESMIMSFCNQQLTSTKKRNVKDIFLQPSRNLASSSTKRSKTSRNVYQRKW